MAVDMENVHYPVSQICDRLTKSLKGLVSERTVREALDTKYKNTEQMTVALQQNHDGGSLYRQQEQLKNKDIKNFTEEDIKVANPTQLRKVAKHQMQRAYWWEQQAKQNQEGQSQAAEQDKDHDKIIADLKKENTKLKEALVTARQLFIKIQDPKLSEEVGRLFRMAAAEILKHNHKTNRKKEKIRLGKMAEEEIRHAEIR